MSKCYLNTRFAIDINTVAALAVSGVNIIVACLEVRPKQSPKVGVDLPMLPSDLKKIFFKQQQLATRMWDKGVCELHSQLTWYLLQDSNLLERSKHGACVAFGRNCVFAMSVFAQVSQQLDSAFTSRTSSSSSRWKPAPTGQESAF